MKLKKTTRANMFCKAGSKRMAWLTSKSRTKISQKFSYSMGNSQANRSKALGPLKDKAQHLKRTMKLKYGREHIIKMAATMNFTLTT